MTVEEINTLRRRLEEEIIDLKNQISGLDTKIKDLEGRQHYFIAGLRQDRERLQDRLTQCMVTHDACWPNAWFVLKTLQDFYTEVPLH